jgi:hypothetical protein
MPDLTLNDYQKLAGRTAGAGRQGERRQIIAALGIPEKLGNSLT